MDALKTLFENFKEKFKASWVEQQESAWFISLKERYEELSPTAQQGVVWGTVGLLIVLILAWPLSNLSDSIDANAQFDERRQALKELLRLERDLAGQPNVPVATAPAALKPAFDQKIQNAGIKPDQIREGTELPTQIVSGAQQLGYKYTLINLTLRQAVDLAYEFEHSDPNLKLAGIEMNANPQDPHFYEVAFKLISFSPKLAEVSPGKSIIDAIKGDKKSKPKDKTDDAAAPKGGV